LRHRPDRARKLFEGTAHRNLLGTIYAVVWRRCCIPDAHWAKCKSAYAWPETYPDWDFLVRLFLNHRGHFVHDASVLFHYDANSPVSRFIVDNRQDLLDAVAQMLLPLSVLIDPDLADLRQQARAEELAQLLSLVQTSISTLMDLSDEVVAFDHPHFAAKLLPRLHQYIEVFRRNPFDWIAARRVRQLRFGLARHWLAVDHGVVRQEYLGPHGEVHRLLLQSGIRKAKLDVREKELLQKTRAELATPLPQSAGHWLALALLGDLRSMPEFTLDKVPDWLRPDFAKYPLAD
jgi:hypothetical protein